ncbi:hypothetical protein PoB_005671300 [Plakobranchus ocellatus]|uniref:Uncharacterized protein n=1 Tax=Plakobranchus ocellatus TaxID=259542 RepID=A0AAV4CGQ8_9GAST|nr:hypothetical protein PoB_005671300 [Plakobranchus ocellatus]
MNNHRNKEVSDPFYCTDSLDRAKNYLMGNVKELRLSRTFQDLSAPLPNIWEGEEGTLELRPLDFPMPPKMSICISELSLLSNSSREGLFDSKNLPKTTSVASAEEAASLASDLQKCVPSKKETSQHFSNHAQPDVFGSVKGQVSEGVCSILCDDVIVIEDDDDVEMSVGNNTTRDQSFSSLVIIDDEMPAAECQKNAHTRGLCKPQSNCSTKESKMTTGNKVQKISKLRDRTPVLEIAHHSVQFFNVDSHGGSSFDAPKPDSIATGKFFQRGELHKEFTGLKRKGNIDFHSAKELSAKEEIQIKSQFSNSSNSLLSFQALPSQSDTKLCRNKESSACPVSDAGESNKDSDLSYGRSKVNSLATKSQVCKKKGNGEAKNSNTLTSDCSDTSVTSTFHHPKLDMAAQSGSDVEAFYQNKIDEWKKVIKDIKVETNAIEMSLCAGDQVDGDDTEKVCETWRKVCFLVECLFIEMEITRMSLKPDNNSPKFSFPVNLKTKIGRKSASNIAKDFSAIKSALNLTKSTFLRLFRANKKIFRPYNKKIKSEDLKIRIPVVFLLNRCQRYQQYQQKLPLSDAMTPGLTAGLYGEGTSVHDHLTKWLVQLNKSSSNLSYEKSTSSGQLAVTRSEVKQPQNEGNKSLVEDSQIMESFETTIADKSDKILTKNNPGGLDLVTIGATHLVNDQVDQNISANELERQSFFCQVQLATSKAIEEGADVAALFDAKFKEWEKRQKYLGNVFPKVYKKIYYMKNNGQKEIKFPEEMARTLAELSYSIEYLHYQMELERMTLTPNSIRKQWLFSEAIASKLGKLKCKSFNRRYLTICRNLEKTRQTFATFYRSYKNSIRCCNSNTKEGQLKIIVPVLVSLSKSGKFAEIVKAKTSKAVQKRFSPGLEAAFFGKQQILSQLSSPEQDNLLHTKPSSSGIIETASSINLSHCHITRYDTASLRSCRKTAANLCTEFMNMYHDLRMQAAEVEHKLKKIDCLFGFECSKSTSQTAAFCQALMNEGLLIQSLYTKYVCAKLSQRSHNRSAEWRFSLPVCDILGIVMKKRLSVQFIELYNILKRLGKTFNNICERNKNAICENNTQVEKKLCVQLPMPMQEISAKIIYLLKKGSITEVPLAQSDFSLSSLNSQEKTSELSKNGKSFSLNASHSNVNVSLNLDEENKSAPAEGEASNTNVHLSKKSLPPVSKTDEKLEHSDLSQIQKNSLDPGISNLNNKCCHEEAKRLITLSQAGGFDDGHFCVKSGLKESSHQHPGSFQDSSGLETITDVEECECGCHGTPLLDANDSSQQNHNQASEKATLWLRLYYLQNDVTSLSNELLRANSQFSSSNMTQQLNACKLVVDLCATLPYLRARLNKERGESFKLGSSGLQLQLIDKSQLKELDLRPDDVSNNHFQKVELSLMSLYDHLTKALTENREIILKTFPHVEEFSRKRGGLIRFFAPGESKAKKVSKNVAAKRKFKANKAARIAADRAMRTPEEVKEEQDFISYQRLCTSLKLLSKLKNCVANVTQSVSKPRGLAKFEVKKDSKKMMKNIFNKIKFCSKKLSSAEKSRDYQKGELPKSLHTILKDFSDDGAGVYTQAQELLRKSIFDFQSMGTKLSPGFKNALGKSYCFEELQYK